MSSTLLQDGYHIRVKQNRKQKRTGAHQTMWISTKRTRQIQLLSEAIPEAISISISHSIPATISKRAKAIPEAIPKSNPEAIPEAIPESNSDHPNCRTLLQEGRLRHWR